MHSTLKGFSFDVFGDKHIIILRVFYEISLLAISEMKLQTNCGSVALVDELARKISDVVFLEFSLQHSEI